MRWGKHVYISRENISDGDILQSGIGTPLHEILHAMAGRHEQSRTDRDEWIQILYNNVQPSEVSNFDAGSDGTDNRVPYDFGSIMQYSLGVGPISPNQTHFSTFVVLVLQFQR